MKYTNVYGDVEDLAVVKPTVQAFNLSYDNETKTLSWERGEGDKVLIILGKHKAVSHLPKNEQTYRVGQWICCDLVIYKGVGTSVDLSALSDGLWYARAFEFNGYSSVEKYLLTTSATNPISFIIDSEEEGIFDDTFDDSFE